MNSLRVETDIVHYWIPIFHKSACHVEGTQYLIVEWMGITYVGKPDPGGYSTWSKWEADDKDLGLSHSSSPCSCVTLH